MKRSTGSGVEPGIRAVHMAGPVGQAARHLIILSHIAATFNPVVLLCLGFSQKTKQHAM